jgi:Catalase
VAEENTPKCPFEHIKNPDLEAKQIAETADLTVKLLNTRYRKPDQPPAPILRGVHPKSHGCVKATFTINADISPEYQVGLFAEPGKQFDAFIRFSNAAGRVSPDTSGKGDHDSRGMAIKVLDVGGEVLIDDNGAHNQDFLMINQRMFAFANTEDYLRLNKVLDETMKFFTDPPDTSEQGVRIAESLEVVKEIHRDDVGNPLGVQYFSAAPFLFGSDRVMKFSAKPFAEVPPTKSPVPPPPRPENYLRDALTETMSRNEELHFDFMLQVRHEGEDFSIKNDPILKDDPTENASIENASSQWDEGSHPFVSVAKITIPAPQLEVDSEENKAHCEKLAFTPWHSLVEHKP